MAVELISEIVQKNNGSFPLVDTNNIRGGIYSVNTIEERDLIPKSRQKVGMLCYVTSNDSYFKLNKDGTWETANFGSIGIPVLDQELINSLGQKVPNKYIGIPNETDISQQALSREVQRNGTYVDILFSALRSLQHEVAKLKNTFASGIISYTDTQTASSDVISEEEEDVEPLWAIDPEDLTEISTVDSTQLLPVNGFVKNEEYITCNDCYTIPDLTDVESAQICTYNIITPKNNWELNLILSNNLSISFSKLIGKQRCNIFTIISRTIKNDEEKELGNKYIWISITDSSNNVIAQGYYNTQTQQLQKFICTLEDNLSISKLEYKNLDLYKSAFYQREQSYTNEDILPAQPSTDDYTFKAAHITIRSVKTKNILDSVANRILNNELVWVESESQLYIKSNYKLIPLSGKGSGGEESGMTEQEVKDWLIANNYITADGKLDGTNLSNLSEITFIHEGSQKKFNITVDSEGTLRSKEITNITEDSGNESKDFVSRGAVAYYNLGVNYETQSAALLSTVQGASMVVRGDRVRISEWYIPTSTQTQFNCSHDFIEITNCGTDNYPLNSAKIFFVKEKDGNKTIESFDLTGTVKAGGSYTIRCKQHLDLNSPIAHVKVKEYDIELWKNGELYDLTGVLAIVLGHKNMEISVAKDSKTKLKSNNSGYFTYKVNPLLIDVVVLDTALLDYFKDGNAYTWADAAYKNNPNSIIKDQYLLDPAKQAFRSLTSKSETSNARLGAVATEIIPLDEEYVSFPHSEQVVPVTNYTPRASYENATVCSDKTSLDNDRPNMLTCAFGINAQKTRCFNWVSVGYHDEYIWLRKKGETTWKRFESYKSGDDTLTQSITYPRKRIFNKTITDYIYNRITGTFPANGQPYTTHKLIIDITDVPLTNQEYEYVAGRSLKNGNFDPNHCSDVYTFTMHDSTWKPRVYQVTDQQGFGWMEYQVWSAAANQIDSQITKECVNKEFPIIINTGDMTQNGTRINEWNDYYNSCLSLNKKYEQMYVIGNNDLANSYSENFLGTGDDNGKSSPYYYNLFYCYEVPSEDFEVKGKWIHPLVYNNKYIPSTYYFYFGNYGYLMVNSELTTVTCNIYYGAPENTNLYTGYHADTKEVDEYCLKNTIESMINKMKGKHIIAACHEMPFTVINIAYLKGDSTNIVNAGADRCLQYKTSNVAASGANLIGSHLNRISADSIWDDEPTNYWFSKLLENSGITLCIGGHKHTYCCTYPIREWRNGDKKLDNVSITKQATIRRSDGTDGTIKYGGDYFAWNVDPNLTTGVVYFMLQATGFKLKSNKELPSREQIFSKIVPKTNNGATADVSQTYPMFAVISYDSSNYNIDLYRISGIKKEALNGNTAKITEFLETAYSTDDMYSEKLLIAKSTGAVEYTNYWLVDNSVKFYNTDKDRCYLDGSTLKSLNQTISGTWNSTIHTEIVPYSYEA